MDTNTIVAAIHASLEFKKEFSALNNRIDLIEKRCEQYETTTVPYYHFKHLEKEFAELKKEVENGSKEIKERLYMIESRLDKLEARFDKLEARFDKLEDMVDKRFNILEETVVNINTTLKTQQLLLENILSNLQKVKT